MNILVIIILLLVISFILLLYFFKKSNNDNDGAIAVFKQSNIIGNVIATNYNTGVIINANFTKLPSGKHGFHIHKAGDLRGEGCQGLCEHFDIGNHIHGGSPNDSGERHTGDLGNIELVNGEFSKRYYIKNISVKDLWGRSVVVHEKEDDLGKGNNDDSKITGNSGARIGCAIFGRILCVNK